MPRVGRQLSTDPPAARGDLGDPAHLPRDVHRLRPDGGRVPGLRAAGGRGLDPGDRPVVRRQHRGDRAAAVRRARAHQRSPSHPRHVGDGARVGVLVADPRRRRAAARFARRRDRRAGVHGRLRVRRDPAAADRARRLQRPRLRPQPRPLQRDQLGGVPGRRHHRSHRCRPAARRGPVAAVHRHHGRRLHRHRRAGERARAQHSGERERRARARARQPEGRRDAARESGD